MKQALVALMVLVGVGYLVKPLRAQTFTSGHDASGLIGQTSFTTTSWSLRARLKPGINTIKLRSTDDLGLSSGFTTVTVTRR